MDLTKIFSGMDKGPEAIQSNFEKINSAVGDKVSSVKVPGTMINGCSGLVDCSKYTIGGRTLNVTQGSFQIGFELNSSTKTIDFAQLATDVDAGVGIAYSNVSNWAVIGTVSANNGKLTLTISNGDASTISKGTWFNFFMIRAY